MQQAIEAHNTMISLPRLALIALVGLMIGTAAGCHKPASFTTRSYYFGSASRDKAVMLGCRNGDKQGRATLFFGAPVAVGSGYGATLWGAPDRTTAQINTLVRDFVRGYTWCRESRTHRLLIGIGTSNSAIDGKSNSWLTGHGKAWSAMVRNVHDWADRYHPSSVTIYGAWNAEPSWSRYEKADAWMHGYDNAYPRRRNLHANFSADGCPSTTATNGSCNNGWNQRRLWHLAWDHDPSLTFPEIYATSGVNARQWMQISEYGHHYQNDGIYFFGVMAQEAACRQSGGCLRTNNTPHQAHDQLLDAVNSHSHTRQPSIDAMTDMHWHW
jgi:hypothetical protein